MAKAYELLEPEFLDLFIKSDQYEFAIGTLMWLIRHLNADIMHKYSDIELEIIRVTRFTSTGYPCIGIYHKNPHDLSNIEPVISEVVERLLKNRSIAELFEFYSLNRDEIHLLTINLINNGM